MDNPLAISLPYIDNRTLDGLTDTYIHNQPLQQEIIQLIENEMKNMKQQNYLKHLPLTINIKQGILFNKNPIVQKEYERLVKNIPTDTIHEKVITSIEPSKNDSQNNNKKKNDTIILLKKQINIAKTIIEEQNVQIGNLELLQHHGGNAWKLHCADVESITNLKSKYTQNLSKELNDVQLQRHDIQERNRKNVHALENEFYILAERNRKMRRRKLKK